jgi:uncharacterized Tic20 family protein
MTDQINSKSGTEKIKPGRSWYVVALLLFLIGAVGGIAILFTSIFTSLSSGTQFVVPGEIAIAVDKPGKYTLWNEVKTIYKGRMYTGSEELPDILEIRITDAMTGETIPMSSSAGGKETIGSTERQAIGNIQFERPGRYRIEVSGDFRARIFMIRRSACGDVLISFAAFFLLSLIGWIGAPLLAIVVLVRRINAKKKIEKPATDTTNGPVQQVTGMPETSTNEEKTWATFCHLGAFSGYFFPFAHIIVPLVLWLIKKDEMPLVNDQGKESLNFQISMTLYYVLSTILIVALIGTVLLIGLNIFNLIVVIIASVKANKGEKFRYPLCIRFIR